MISERRESALSGGTVLTCPVCGETFSIGVTFDGATFANNGGANISVPCPRGHRFDAAPRDGTYKTGSDGRLRLVAEVRRAWAQTDRDQLRDLAAALRENTLALRDQQELLRLTQTVAPSAMDGVVKAIGLGGSILGIIGFILQVIQLMLGGATLEKETPAAPPSLSPPAVSVPTLQGPSTPSQPIPRTPGSRASGPSLNQPCYCGSKRKYKRCHGAEDGVAPVSPQSPLSAADQS